MQTYTLLFDDPQRTHRVCAVTIRAESARQAVEVVRALAPPSRCELWSDGAFVCSLRTLAMRGRWMVASGL